MTSSRTISLFAAPPPQRTGPSSFMISTLAHGAVLGLMLLAIAHAPRIAGPQPSQRYTVRLLKLQRTEPRMRWSPGSGGQHAAPHQLAQISRSGGHSSAPSAPRQLAQRSAITQTLIQPDAPKNLAVLPQTPLPTVVIWKPESARILRIIPPPPQKAVAAKVIPVLTRPNHEPNISDIQLSSTAFTSATIPVAASTTSPVAMHVPGIAQVPQSTSNAAALPTPATVMSVSELAVPQGTVALPLVDQIASGSGLGSLAPGRSDGAAGAGTGIASGPQNGTGAGTGNRNGSGYASGDGTASGVGQGRGENGAGDSASNGSGGSHGSGIGTDSGSDTGSLTGDPFALDRITLPRNGQYGVVVVGGSLAEQYPETLGIWGDRLAYTVYLHVGLTRNWILEYSLPRLVQTAGNTARPDAPWPYIMVRPHIMPGDSDSDAIMVHGFINSGGRFEQLAIVFPPQFAQTKFVLGSLQQWEFRPAVQNGRQTAVEVLLIIPEEAE